MWRQKHRKMATKVQSLDQQFKDGKISNPIEISNFLKNWLEKHILQTDKHYGTFLTGKGVK